jgi:hypothetical protein
MSIVFEPIPEKNSTIASGATPIGSAVAHPVEKSWQKEEELKSIIKNQLVDKWFRCNRLYFVSNELRLHCQQNKHRLLPSGAIYESCKVQLGYFVYWNSQTRLQNMILKLRHYDKTWMPWLKYIMKVRPQDPSCVARYTHMDMLCWYLSVSTKWRKILVDALGTLRITGIHSL